MVYRQPLPFMGSLARSVAGSALYHRCRPVWRLGLVQSGVYFCNRSDFAAAPALAHLSNESTVSVPGTSMLVSYAALLRRSGEKVAQMKGPDCSDPLRSSLERPTC